MTRQKPSRLDARKLIDELALTIAQRWTQEPTRCPMPLAGPDTGWTLAGAGTIADNSSGTVRKPTRRASWAAGLRRPTRPGLQHQQQRRCHDLDTCHARYPQDPDFSISSSDPQSESTRGDEHSKLLRAAQTIGPLGTALFGESVNLFTGSTEFKHTDVSIPGHVGPAVSVGRRFVMEDRKVYWSQYLFADWDLDIPYLGNVGPDNAPWRVKTADPAARCSSPQNASEAAPPDVGQFHSKDFWQGIHLNNVAGGGAMLWNSVPDTQRPGPASTWKWSTKGNRPPHPIYPKTDGCA